MTDQAKTLYEQEMETEHGRHGLAAAAAASQTMSVLERAKATSGITNKELADRLGVSEGRVSQVLNGDGNLHIATVARFLSAIGFHLAVRAKSDDGTYLGEPKSRRHHRVPARQSCVSDYALTWGNTDGLHVTTVQIEHPESATSPSLLSALLVRRNAGSTVARWRTADAKDYQHRIGLAIDAEHATVGHD